MQLKVHTPHTKHITLCLPVQCCEHTNRTTLYFNGLYEYVIENSLEAGFAIARGLNLRDGLKRMKLTVDCNKSILYYDIRFMSAM